MTIQELKPSKRIAGRWLAVLEDGSILRVGENEVVSFSLYPGKELTDEQTEALLASTRCSGLKEKALALLSRKPHSRRELERKLEQWEATEEEISSICNRMEELGYLNDAYYAEQVVKHYCTKGYGEKKLRDELYRRGVPRDLWDDALAKVEDNSSALDQFIARKLAGKEPDPRDLQKVAGALARRGYNWSEIRDALARYGAEAEDFD